MSNVLDTILADMQRQCQARARKKVANELAGLKKENKRLKEKINTISTKLSTLEHRERGLKGREKEVKKLENWILAEYKRIDALKKKTIGSVISNPVSYGGLSGAGYSASSIAARRAKKIRGRNKVNHEP